MNIEKKPLNTMIVYHDPCIDGITSAAVVSRYLIEKCGLLDEEIFPYPMSYDDDLLELMSTLDANSIIQLYIVDFSFKVVDLLRLYECIPASIYLYDHHASAFRNLMGADYPLSPTSSECFDLRDEHNDPTDIHIVLDNNECGASLCWKWLMEAPDRFDDTLERNLPHLIRHVKDNDLWRFELGYTKALNKYLRQQPKTLANFRALLTEFEDAGFLNKAFKEGKVILEYESKLEDDLIERGVCPLQIEGISGLSCNAPAQFSSNIGHKLALESKTFGAVWSQLADGKIAFSLRSNGDECDVSKLAECMGGGGHKNAAGFSFMSPSYDVETGITLWSKLPEAEEGHHE